MKGLVPIRHEIWDLAVRRAVQDLAEYGHYNNDTAGKDDLRIVSFALDAALQRLGLPVEVLPHV